MERSEPPLSSISVPEMKATVSAFQDIETLDEVGVWLGAVKRSGLVPPTSEEEVEAFVAKFQVLRKTLSPYAHPTVTAAVGASITGAGAGFDFRAVVSAVPRAAEFKTMFEELALIVGQVRGAKSRRAATVRVADADLFTAHAGKVYLPANAVKDRHGNAGEDTYLLARDGACRGMRAVVLVLFDPGRHTPWPANWYDLFVAMLSKKGLAVTCINTWDFEHCSPRSLQRLLANAAECWVISSETRKLTNGHVRVIRAAWRAGMGLYIAGDNEPFFEDANFLLQAIGLPVMSGSYIGQQVLTLERGQYSPHFVTTGIQGGLFSGVTVADFDVGSAKARALECGVEDGNEEEEEEGEDMEVEVEVEVECEGDGEGEGGSDSNSGSDSGSDSDTDGTGRRLVISEEPLRFPRRFLPFTVIATTGEIREGVPCAGILAHEGSPTTGRVIADGAFTRLFIDWTKHGTPQYVGNTACYLASAASTAPEPAHASTSLAFDYAGAPSYSCAITHVDTAAAGFVMLYGAEPFKIEKDQHISDPLEVGLRLGAGVVSTEVLAGEELAALVRDTCCPFTRRPVLATIPVVSLTSATNRRLLGHILAGVFTEGAFVRAAWLTFFGVCIRAAARASESDANPYNPYGFFVQQILDNITMSVAFANVAPFVPLRNAINTYAIESASDPLSRVRKSMATIAEGMCPFVADPAVPPRWIRHKLLLQAVQQELRAAKEAASLHQYAARAVVCRFKCSFGRVPIAGTATCPDASSMFEWCRLVVQLVLRTKTPSELCLKPSDFLVAELAAGTSLLAAAWKDTSSDDAALVARMDLVQVLEGLYSGMHQAATAAIPPFATVYGPSVLFAADGSQFYHGDLATAGENSQEVLAARRAYLTAVYGADHPQTASNYSLHATARVVMVQKFRDAVTYDPEQAKAVADALVQRGTGNMYTEDFEDVVAATVKSYLAARVANNATAHPLQETKQLRIPLHKQLTAELVALGFPPPPPLPLPLPLYETIYFI
jgi:hypothetical protein